MEIESRVVKIILKKKNKIEEIIILNFRIYCKVIVIKITAYSEKTDKQINGGE